MKRTLAILLVMILCLSMLAACDSGQAPSGTPTPQESEAPESEAPQESEAPETEAPQETGFTPVGREGLDGKKVIFFGNSHTYYGKCVINKAQDEYTQEERMNDEGYFYQLCKANGIDVNVTNFTFGVHQLIDFYSGSCAADRGHDGLDHFSQITDPHYDYVIIQASADTVDILEECQLIMQFFQEANPDVQCVFIAHHRAYNDGYAYLNDLEKLKDAGILVVDWGILAYDLINGDAQVPGATQEYNYNTFIISKSETDGYHPNMLSGYITALMTYCAITGESAQGQPVSFDDPKFDPTAIAEHRAQYYTYNPETNFDVILDSEADMAGIQQLIDQYLEAHTYS